MIRILFRCLQLFISPLILPAVMITGALYFLGNTTLGLQTVLQLANQFVPGELKVQHAEGKLLSVFTLNNISYRNGGTEVTIQFFDFAWKPKQLLEKKLSIQHLIFHDTVIKVTSTPGSSDTSFNLDKLAFYLQHLRIDQTAIYNVAFSQNNKPAIEIDEIRIQQHDAESFSFSAKSSNGNIEGTIANNWNARWNFQVADLSTLIPASRGNITLSGTIAGPRMTPTIAANLLANQLFYKDQKIDKLTGKINLILKPDTLSNLSLNATGIKVDKYVFKNTDIAVSGKTTKNQKNWLTSLAVALNKQPFVTASLSIPASFDLDNFNTQPLYAKLNFTPIKVESLTSYLPNIKNLHGNVIGAIELNGSLDKPHYSGELTFNNGSITIPELGITLKNIVMHIVSDENKRLTYSGHFSSDKGNADIQGTTDLAQADFPSTVTLRGKDLQVANLAEYKIHASPDITLKLADKNLLLEGNIFIPEAKITPKNFSSVVTLPSDVVFVGAKKPATPALLEKYLPSLQLTMTLGDKIYLHYQDLEATLKGSVVITKAPNSPATGVGELFATNGTYNAYKKILAIKEGRLVYTGNLITNPGLNIKATREMKTVQTGSMNDFTTNQTYEGTQTLTVGVQVTGTLDKPTIALYSSPSLSQVDVLSYLILGIPSSQASGTNSQALLAAASALDLGGSGVSHLANITNGLKKKLGLAELNVESVQTFDPTANQNTGGVVGKTSLVVGKQLATNLYVHYSTSLDVLNPVSTFNLRYKLSKRFSIQSETSTIDTGADLLYSIERD